MTLALVVGALGVKCAAGVGKMCTGSGEGAAGDEYLK